MAEPSEVPLREYVERLVSDLDRRVDQRFIAQDDKTALALQCVRETRTDTRANAAIALSIVFGILSIVISVLMRHAGP